MKVSTEIDNNFGYEKITQLVDNIPLNNGIINAIFQLLGNILHWKDLLNSKDNGFATSFLTTINILLLIISGPTALLRSKIFRTPITSCSLTTNVVKVLQPLSSKSGRSIPSSSKSVIEQNYLFNISHFSTPSFVSLNFWRMRLQDVCFFQGENSYKTKQTWTGEVWENVSMLRARYRIVA